VGRSHQEAGRKGLAHICATTALPAPAVAVFDRGHHGTSTARASPAGWLILRVAHPKCRALSNVSVEILIVRLPRVFHSPPQNKQHSCDEQPLLKITEKQNWDYTRPSSQSRFHIARPRVRPELVASPEVRLAVAQTPVRFQDDNQHLRPKSKAPLLANVARSGAPDVDSQTSGLELLAPLGLAVRRRGSIGDYLSISLLNLDPL
jgi:hypothetical protein